VLKKMAVLYPALKMLRNYVRARYFFKPAPLWLDFRVTNKCNYRCAYCSIPTQTADEITTAEVKTVIDKTKHIGNWVLLTGGECLLRKDIGEIVDYIKTTTDMRVTVNTNMFLLQETFEKIRRADFLFFSIDGREETHDTYRSKGSYSKVIEGLEFLRHSRGTIRTIRTMRGLLSLTVLHKGTQKSDLEHVLQLSDRYSFGANFQLIRHYSASGRSQELDPHSAHKLDLLDYLLEQKSRGRFITNTTRNLKILKDIARGIDIIPCYSGRLFCYITSEGKVALCFSRPDHDRYLNLRDKSVTFEMALQRLTEIRPERQRCPGCTCTTPIELAAFSFFDFRMISETLRTFGWGTQPKQPIIY
jgi:MoaA/NifB/PqqE/SkfB family radical SAM enzyme